MKASAVLIASLGLFSPHAISDPRPIESMNITGGFVLWSLPGGSTQLEIFSGFGPDTNLVGGYIGTGGSTSLPSDPPNPDNIVFFTFFGGLNEVVTYTAASNLGTAVEPAGVTPGGPVPAGSLDGTLNTIEMDLSSWFGNINNATDVWAGTGIDDGVTSPLATGTWNPETHEYELTWTSRVPDSPTNPFPGLESTWTLTGLAYPAAISVTIDIKPGSDPNCFNINGHGVIPVAIFGADDFYVTDIDVASRLFGGLEVRLRGNKGPLCSVEYSNDDAHLDLVCHFEDDAERWTPGDDEATLTGNLLDGTPIEGSDSICISP